MNFEIRYINTKGYFIIKTFGPTTTIDVENSLIQLFKRQNWSTGTNILYDNRLEIFSDLSFDIVQEISQKFIQFNDKLNGSKIALVVSSEVAFGFARMWEMNSEFIASFKTKIFRSFDDAIKWIETENSDNQKNG